ncbi:MAG: precorrin-6A reductase [Lachnospiraceae bacterium]|nr:precorrin-6A reductase [Lachnospiraceae bacterium]
MTGCIVFSGTTEGRNLSDALSAHRIKHIVCVAGKYGEEMMEEDPCREVHVGRMDAEEMKGFFSASGLSEEAIIVDATHPYASEVTKNIKAACAEKNLRYIRVIRSGDESIAGDFPRYATVEDCAKALNNTDSNILLTTGSKELGVYVKNVSEDVLARTYVRVLPSVESLEKCAEAGIEKTHIIAMHGPFSRDMNAALIRQYSIKHLVTKESGEAGGFDEKIGSAMDEGIIAHIIERPSKEEGMSVSAAISIVLGESAPAMTVTLAGIGMGSKDCMTCAVSEAINECDILFGAERLLEGITRKKAYKMYKASDIIPVLEREKPIKPVILFSGDSGFYSGTAGMIAALRKWDPDVHITVLPGISSFSYMAAKLGISYDDAVLFSLHGRDDERNLSLLAEKVKYNAKVITLLSGSKDIRKAVALIKEQDINGRLIAGIDLSYDREKIVSMTFDEAAEFDEEGIVTAVLINDEPLKKPLINVVRDEDMIRGDIPMTKECIRHESIIRLGLCEGDVMYDIGGGTGSVSVEAASLSNSITVYSFEKKPEAVKLIKENIAKAGLQNVSVIEGNAPETFDGLPAPDRVFIGGSDGKLGEMIKYLSDRKKGIRYVINAVSLETMEEVKKLIREYEITDNEIIQISVAGVRKAGEHHLLSAQNPVWIFSFTI